MRSRPKLWIALVMILGVATGLLVYRFLMEMQAVSRGDIPMSPQVVARVRIPAGTEISGDMLQVKEVPETYAHPDALKDPTAAIGLFAATDIVPGEVVLASKVSSKETKGELAYRVPAGYRAITVPVNSLTGVAGQVKPGQYVDVVVVYTPSDRAIDSKVHTILQQTLVLAVGFDLQEKEDAQIADTVTLAVTPNDAQTVALATAIGKIVLTLRPADDDSKARLESTDVGHFQTIYP